MLENLTASSESMTAQHANLFRHQSQQRQIPGSKDLLPALHNEIHFQSTSTEQILMKLSKKFVVDWHKCI